MDEKTLAEKARANPIFTGNLPDRRAAYQAAREAASNRDMIYIREVLLLSRK